MNKARKEIFRLIDNAESKTRVPRGVLSRIYELEEDVVHMRTRRDMRHKINEIITSAIENHNSSKSWLNQQPQSGST